MQGQRAVRRAVESEEGGGSFQREVISHSWPPFLFEHLPAAGKNHISLLCDVAWEKLLKVRITVVFLDRCCPPLCLPSCSCLVLHLLKERSLHQGMPYFKNCAWLFVTLSFCKCVSCFSGVGAAVAPGAQSSFRDQMCCDAGMGRGPRRPRWCLLLRLCCTWPGLLLSWRFSSV